jgi:hypothetical protein
LDKQNNDKKDIHKDEILEEVKAQPVDKKLRRYKLAIICNKNEQKQY